MKPTEDDSDNKEAKKDNSSRLIEVAIWASFFYILTVGYFALQSSWMSFTHNSLGDFLAGACAPLAFFWFVVTVFLQRMELKELRIETKRLADASDLQATHFGASLDLDRRAQSLTEIKSASDECDARIRKLLKIAETLRVAENIHGTAIDVEHEDFRNMICSGKWIERRTNGTVTTYQQSAGLPFPFQNKPLDGDNDKRTSINFHQFHNLCLAWTESHMETHGALWDCINAATDQQFTSAFLDSVTKLDAWYTRTLEESKLLNYQQFELDCIEMGINHVFSALRLMGVLPRSTPTPAPSDVNSSTRIK